MGLHPKVKWPLIVNAILTVVAAIFAAWTKGDQVALTAAITGGIVTIVGLVTGYTVPSPQTETMSVTLPASAPKT
jgi:hypothetical protein